MVCDEHASACCADAYYGFYLKRGSESLLWCFALTSLEVDLIGQVVVHQRAERLSVSPRRPAEVTHKHAAEKEKINRKYRILTETCVVYGEN